jgi:hypothetical protein
MPFAPFSQHAEAVKDGMGYREGYRVSRLAGAVVDREGYREETRFLALHGLCRDGGIQGRIQGFSPCRSCSR